MAYAEQEYWFCPGVLSFGILTMYFMASLDFVQKYHGGTGQPVLSFQWNLGYSLE